MPSVLGTTVEEAKATLSCLGFGKVGAVNDLPGDTRPVADSWLVVRQLPLPDSTDVPAGTEVALAARPPGEVYSSEVVSGECKNNGIIFVPYDEANPTEGDAPFAIEYVVTLRNTSVLPAKIEVRFYFEDFDQPASGVGPERYTRWGTETADGAKFTRALQPGEEATISDLALVREPGSCHIQQSALAP